MAKTLFETLYEGCEKTIKAMKLPLAKSSLKRKIRQGYDDAQNSIDHAKNDIHEEVAKVLECDLNKCLTLKGQIRNYTEAQDDLKELYHELFDEELNVEID